MSNKNKEFDLLIQEAQKLLPAKSPSMLTNMMKLLCDKINRDDIEFFDPQILSNMIISHWNMAKDSKGGKPELRIYCPSIEDGECRKTVIDIVSDDLAFLVDSIAAEINKHNLLIGILIHPILNTSYDAKGKLINISNQISQDSKRQSHIHIQINETISEEVMNDLTEGLYTVLSDVLHANADWQVMLEKLKQASIQLNSARTLRPAAEIQEYCAFLDYLHSNNFTLLGCREYKFIDGKDGLSSKTVAGSSLGLLHNGISPAYLTETEEGLPRNLQELRRRLPPVSISKTNRLSTVHRSVPMDCIAVKVYNDRGEVVGEKLFLGLMTSVTYSRSVSDIPYLRAKVEETIKASEFMGGTHNAKALRHILEKYPRDELFQIESKELLKTCLNIIRLQERQRIALFMRKDPFGRYISCLVYIPRDRFGTKLRKDIQKILEKETKGKCVNFYTTLDDSVFARVMYIINISQKNQPKISPKAIEQKLRDCGQTWSEKLSQALSDAYQDEKQITDLTLRYSDAFPIFYTTKYQANHSIFDIEKIEAALSSKYLILDLYRPDNMDKKNIRLKVFHVGSPVTLSDVLPILEDMGLRVISELPFEIKPKDSEESVWIHDFLLETNEMEDPVVIKDIKHNFERAFVKTWDNNIEKDSLNHLILSAGVNWREITILRSYVRYIKQLSFPYSSSYIEKALTDNPKISNILINIFKAMHDPYDNSGNKDGNNGKASSLIETYEINLAKELDKVKSGDYDRILRTITGLIKATLRTNYFQRQENGSSKPCLSLKFDCSEIMDMPAPKPFREIFVYSPRVEAVHLRGDKIARGGLRWSDRHEDFRTEILGLMKAQMVKNSVIVPMGSKGGFVVKTPTNTRDEFIKEGIECYKIFIRGMLDITDNQNGKKIIPPANTVRHDGDDPYLVVAADKGTATFSDIANSMSQDYNFWLDDAFASGGSAGYDHKKMGITARGAWESVKHHFRLFNHDTQNQPFDVVGVGDMGGDVFGNGMILSEHIRLIGSFNHLHIFCDPSPDPAKTFKERKRLFDCVGGWDKYNEKLLSKGGRIYKRSDKILTLTPEIQKRFDIEKVKVTPNELIRAMLKARTDLLWFGGIGTYIKSTSETHTDVGDKASDNLRIDADMVRTKVIGEGANLGITQLGRIEMSEHGVRLNTDFLDNSAGVDCSDHEVNIKILMNDIMAQKDHNMDLKARNKLLEEMTDEVAEHVLRHNYQQAQAISLIEMHAHENLQMHNEFIQYMEREHDLDREIEGLPDQDIIAQRLRNNKGLTRPELCVIFAYAKIILTRDILDSDIPDNPEMNYWIMDYFPEILGKKYKKEILRHKLKREIIATMMANSLINRMGPTFLQDRMNKTNATVNEITQAYIFVRDTFNLRDLWDGIENIDSSVPAQIQLKAMHDIALLSEHGIAWFLMRMRHGDMSISKNAKEFGEGIKLLSKNLDKLVTDKLRITIQQRRDTIISDGISEELAHQIALIPVLSSACDIIRISIQQNTDIQNTARIYFEIGERFNLAWLRQQSVCLEYKNSWQDEVVSGLVDSFYSCQSGLTLSVLQDIGSKTSAVSLWLKKHENIVKQFDPLFDDLHISGSIDLTILTLVEQRLRNLYDN